MFSFIATPAFLFFFEPWEGAFVDSEPEGSKSGERRRSQLLIGMLMIPRGGDDPKPSASAKDCKARGGDCQGGPDSTFEVANDARY